MRRTLLIAVGTLVFLAIALLVGRYLSTESRERAAVDRVLNAQARGDAAGMLAALDGSCRADPHCRATVVADARRLRRPGTPKIIAYDSKTSYVLGAATGTTRVAWTIVGRGLPVVQCVVVHRGGSVIAGRTVRLLRISAPIGNESTC
ncbi:MAG: hypothetical protein QOF12_2228 [Solirubrobacteraceae bacterium]|nr:hypothetical protein [Solirubrobacteraceae bacterium]